MVLFPTNQTPYLCMCKQKLYQVLDDLFKKYTVPERGTYRKVDHLKTYSVFSSFLNHVCGKGKKVPDQQYVLLSSWVQKNATLGKRTLIDIAQVQYRLWTNAQGH